MPRNEGQLPPPLATDHTHAVDHVVDPITGDPADLGAGGGGVSVTDGTTTVAATQIQMPSGTVSDSGGGVAAIGLVLQRIGPFHVAFDTVGINGRLHVGPELVAGTVVLRAWAQVVDGDPHGGLWDGASAIVCHLGVEDAADWDSVTVFKADNGVYATMPTEYRFGLEGAITNYVETHIGVVRAAPGHLYVTFADLAADAPTQGEADVYAIIATPAS